MKRLHWSLYALLLIVGITALGAVLGAVLFPLWGVVFSLQKSSGELAVFGIRTLSFYFLMWAPGIAIVLCVKRAYEARVAKEEGGNSCPPSETS